MTKDTRATVCGISGNTEATNSGLLTQGPQETQAGQSNSKQGLLEPQTFSLSLKLTFKIEL